MKLLFIAFAPFLVELGGKYRKSTKKFHEFTLLYRSKDVLMKIIMCDVFNVLILDSLRLILSSLGVKCTGLRAKKLFDTSFFIRSTTQLNNKAWQQIRLQYSVFTKQHFICIIKRSLIIHIYKIVISEKFFIYLMRMRGVKNVCFGLLIDANLLSSLLTLNNSISLFQCFCCSN